MIRLRKHQTKEAEMDFIIFCAKAIALLFFLACGILIFDQYYEKKTGKSKLGR